MKAVRAALKSHDLGGGALSLSGYWAYGRTEDTFTWEATDKAAALSREPPPGKALLFVYREGFVAKLAGLNIAVDEKPVAQLKSPRFTCIVVPAGPHGVSAKFGGLAGAQSLMGECRLDAPADGVAAVRIGVRMTMGRNGIDLEPQADMAGVRARLAGMPMTPPDPAEL